MSYIYNTVVQEAIDGDMEPKPAILAALKLLASIAKSLDNIDITLLNMKDR